MYLPKIWLILTILLAWQVLGPNINVFFEKAQQYNIDPLTAAAVIKCESGGNPKAFHKNINGSIDRGLMQINSTHSTEAASMGDDITTVEGNLDYGFYLASKRGFGPWTASQSCIGKTLNELGQETS